MKKRLLAVIIAALFVMASLPASALRGTVPMRYATPEGYNDHDYQKLIAFLEKTDADGVKNGTKIISGYDPADPGKWWNSDTYTGLMWRQIGGSKRIYTIIMKQKGVVGPLDLSGCTELNRIECSHNPLLSAIDVSGDAALEEFNCQDTGITAIDLTDNTNLLYFYCGDNQLTELDVSNNTKLYMIFCENNALKELDVSKLVRLTNLDCSGNALNSIDISNNTAVWNLDCSDNQLTSLDLSKNTELKYVKCMNNSLTKLDLTNSPKLKDLDCKGNRITEITLAEGTALSFVSVKAANGGAVAFYYTLNDQTWDYDSFVTAVPDDGNGFLGWYSDSGELLSDSATLACASANEIGEQRIIARFSILGDVDGNGAVEASDALLALRMAMNIIDTPADISLIDVDKNGKVEATDALLILRFAMGIIDHF